MNILNLESIKKNIITTKKGYDKRNEYPVDCEFTLPDYCPDIERILKCNIISRVANLSVLSDTAQVDINAVINVLYVTKDDKLFGYEMPMNISKTIPVGEMNKETIKTYSTKTEYVNCRAVNNRKIDVHGSISVLLKLFVNDEKNYIADISDSSVVLKKQCEKVLQQIGFASKQVNIADDIVLSNASGSVSNVIRSDACVTVDECKTLPGKAIVKLTAQFELLYLSTDLRYECIRHSIPINQVIDIEGTDENSICKVNADVCSVTFKPVTNSEGEMRTINTTAKVNISVVSNNLVEVDMVTDGYSIKYESELERDTIGCERFIASLNDNITVSECINVSSQISEIVDLRCTPLHYNFKNENGNTFICGDIAVCISLEDENDACKYYEKVVTYNEKIPVRDCDESCNFDLCVTPISCSYTISSGNAVDFRTELNVNGFVTKPFNMNAVTRMKIDEQKEKNYDDMPSLVVYYGSQGESIWDIALRYNTSADKICEANNITEDVLSGNTMLLIPCM